jgi:DNA (cytosine-5)-methyltransferase 1
MASIIGAIQPSYVWLENSPMLVGRGLAVVLGDLAKMGYDAQWRCVSAAECGAPHRRDRIWLVAHTGSQHGAGIITGIADSKVWTGSIKGSVRPCRDGAAWWAVEPGMGRVADGLAYRVDRIKALGNGQVPIVAASAFELLTSAEPQQALCK